MNRLVMLRGLRVAVLLLMAGLATSCAAIIGADDVPFEPAQAGAGGGGTGGAGGAGGSTDAGPDVSSTGGMDGAAGAGGLVAGGGGSGGVEASAGAGGGGVIDSGSDAKPDAGIEGGDAGCVPESDTTFCARLGRNCGTVSGNDNCGASRTVTSCGACTAPDVCSAGNVCGPAVCTPESNAEFCTRLGKNCGAVAAVDNCGTSRAVASCGGACTAAQFCGASNVCTTCTTCGVGTYKTGGCSGTADTTCATCAAACANGWFTSQACTPTTNHQCVEAPSCSGGLTCGSPAESCCTTINVPGGTFPQGRTMVVAASDYYPSGSSDEVPEWSSTVSSFALDKYEVTVGRFRKFVNAYVDNTKSAPAAGAGANPNVSGSGWPSAWNTYLPATQATFTDTAHLNCNVSYQTWTNAAGANENKPVTCVDWYEAFAFCIWDGGRLPTESEWEYAAAGGGGVGGNRLYPWGVNAPDCSYANFSTGVNCGPNGNMLIAPVGSYPVGNGNWGHADLAGNVAEWVMDWLALYPSAGTNYADISSGSYRVIRGGHFYSSSDTGYLRAASRSLSNGPGGSSFTIGLRCSRTVQ